MPLSPRQTNVGIPLHSQGRGGGLRETVGEIPPEWRSALDLFTLVQPVPYDSDIPELSDTILSTRLEQTVTAESMLHQVTKPAGIVTLEETYTDKYKQVGSRIKKFRPITDLPLIGVPSSTRDVQTKNFGNYHFEETLEDSGTLFSEQSFVTERPDVTPEKFKALIPLETEGHVEEGIAEQPILDPFEYREAQGQRDVFTKSVESKFRDPTELPAVLGMWKMTPEQQIAQGVDILDLGLQDISTISAETVEASSESLGDGTSIKRQYDVGEMFHGEKFVVERDLLGAMPPEFRAGLERVTASAEIEGIAELPILFAGIDYKSEEQTTVFKKKIEQRGLDFSTVGSLPGEELTELYGGGVLDIVKQLDDAPLAVSGGYLVTEGKAQAIGGGLYIKETKVRESTPWPVLYGQQYDERLDVVLPFVQQVKDASTIVIGTAKTEIEPLDMWRSKARTIDTDAVADVLDAYVLSYPSKINVDLPDRLVSLAGVLDSSIGEGASSEDGTWATTNATYSVSQSLKASAQSSINIAADVGMEIEQFWGNNIDCTNYQFFLPNPVTPADVLTKLTALAGAISAWPKYNPAIVNIVSVSKRASLQVSASSQGSLSVASGGDTSTTGGGTGYSRELGMTMRITRISPTIHGAISMTGTTTFSDTITAHADAEAAGLGPFEEIDQTQSITGFVAPTSIPATAGDTTWPSSGKFLYKVDAQPYRYGYVQLHCVVVDASDFP